MDQHRSQSHRSTRASLLPTGSTFRGSLSNNGYRQKSLVLESAITEYLKLRDQGLTVDVQEFCNRYPDYRKSVQRMIDVEESLPPVDDVTEDGWPTIGGTFLGYEILDLLGAGSIASVFLASEVELGGRLVALKVSRHGGYEAELLGKLRHPNIVEVYSVRHDPQSELTAVCMPYQGTATLADVLDAAYREKKPPRDAKIIADVAQKLSITAVDSEDASARPDRLLEKAGYVDGVVHLGIQLAGALQYAHDRGILHRDLKPSNVLLTPQGCPMLLDFNLSFDAAMNVNPRGGTLPYASPEQLRDSFTQADEAATLDVRSDVFSLGVILYELLTGELPFGAPPPNMGPRLAIQRQIDALTRPPVPVSTLNEHVDSELEEMIHRCLSADPAGRFATMSELETALRRSCRLAPKIQRWIRHHPWKVWSPVAGITAILAFLAVYIATLPPYPERQMAAGLAAFHEGDYSQSVDRFTRVIEVTPEHGLSYFHRGLALQAMKEHGRAVKDFESAYRLKHETHALHDHWGYSLFQLGRTNDAIYAYTRGLQKNPSDPRLYLKRAYCRYKGLRLPPVSDVQQALKLNPVLVEAYWLRALSAFDFRHKNKALLDGAVQDIQLADAQMPGNAHLEYAAAIILAAASSSNLELERSARKYLELAVDHGISREPIEQAFAFQSWKAEDWFLELLERCNAKPNHSKSLEDLVIRLSPTDLQP